MPYTTSGLPNSIPDYAVLVPHLCAVQSVACAAPTPHGLLAAPSRAHPWPPARHGHLDASTGTILLGSDCVI
jgi:hypothetical protein